MYIHHAKNIAEGIDYNKTGYIYNPDRPTIGPKTYPPVFPLILSPIYTWFGLNLTAMKIEIILMFCMFLFVYYLILRMELPYKFVVLAILLIGCNPYYWDYKDNVLSDLPFLLWTYTALLIILHAHQSNSSKRTHLLYSIFAGIIIYLTYGTRSIGILLVPCLFIHDAIRYKKPTQFSIIATIIFLTFMLIQSFFFHSDRSYLENLSFNPMFLLQNLLFYGKYFVEIWDNGYSVVLSAVLFTVFFILTIIGYMDRIQSRITILEVFTPLYMGSLIILPYFQQRYLIPVIPLCVMYALIGITKFKFIQSREARRYFVSILIVAFFITYLGKYTKSNFDSIDIGVGRKESIKLFEYIRSNTDESDIFIFRKPRVLSLYTGRSAAAYHLPNDEEELWQFFRSIGANYLIVGQIDPKYIHLFIEKYENNFEKMFLNFDFKVYKIKYKNNDKLR